MTITAWYSVPELREELARLIKNTALSTALEVLSLQAKARMPSMQVDVTTLALTHAHLAGYQKALDDLVALTQPPLIAKRAIVNSGTTDEWGHAAASAKE